MGIEIDIPCLMCRAGDTISGKVILSSHKPVGTNLVTVSLVGQCRTRVTRDNGYASQTYSEKINFFNETKELFKGPQNVSAGTSWPFTFTIPKYCNNAQFRTPIVEYLFNSDPRQILPPSYGSGKYRANRIEYSLQATLERSKRHGLSRHARAIQYLAFFATRDVDVPDPQLYTEQREFVHRSLRVDSEHADSHIISKVRRRSTRKDKPPKARFALNVLLPRVALPRQALPIKISLHHDNATSTAMPFPAVFLKKCKIHMRMSQYMRCYYMYTSVRRKKKLGRCDFSRKMHAAPPITEGLDLRELMELEPPDLMPSWSTFSFVWVHTLRVKLSVKCAGQTFKVKCDWQPIKVLPISFIGERSLWDDDDQKELVPARDAGVAPVNNTRFGVDGALPMWEDVKPAGFVLVLPTDTVDLDPVLLSEPS